MSIWHNKIQMKIAAQFNYNWECGTKLKKKKKNKHTDMPQARLSTDRYNTYRY